MFLHFGVEFHVNDEIMNISKLQKFGATRYHVISLSSPSSVLFQFFSPELFAIQLGDHLQLMILCVSGSFERLYSPLNLLLVVTTWILSVLAKPHC